MFGISQHLNIARLTCSFLLKAIEWNQTREGGCDGCSGDREWVWESFIIQFELQHITKEIRIYFKILSDLDI